MSLSLATGLLDSPALIRWQRQAQDGITRRLLCDQGYSRTSAKQKRTFTTLHCEPVFNPVLENNEPRQWFGNSKLLDNEKAAPFVHDTCSYAVFDYEAMDRSL